MNPLEILEIIEIILLYIMIVASAMKICNRGFPDIVMVILELFLTIFYATTSRAVWAATWGFITGLQMMMLVNDHIGKNR